jgi:hypothetical protein
MNSDRVGGWCGSSMKRAIAAASLFVLPISGCGSSTDDPGPQGTNGLVSGSVSCGTLTCNAAQTCLVSQSLLPFSEGLRSYSCIETPAGCGGLELCDCPATQGDLQGKPITGCSLLGERSLYVTDVTCGERRCSSDEYCLVKHEGAGVTTTALSKECVARPSGCADVCATDCKAQVAAHEGLQVIGCLTSEFAQAISFWSP